LAKGLPEGGFVPLGAIGGLGGITPASKAPASNVEVVNQIEETVSGD